jgi:nicotinate-nucleotide adenylyltransferase
MDVPLGNKRGVGVDIAPEAAEKSPHYFKEFYLFDIERIGEEEIPELLHRFHTVILSETLEHFRDPALILEKANWFLKPGGKILLTYPNAYSIAQGIDRIAHFGRWHRFRDFHRSHIFLVKKKELEGLFGRAGLRIVYFDLRPSDIIDHWPQEQNRIWRCVAKLAPSLLGHQFFYVLERQEHSNKGKENMQSFNRLPSRRKRIGIFGGAFDPPQIGHVKVIRSVLISGHADEVWVLPAGRRIEKRMATQAKDRLAMCVLMVKENFRNDAPVSVKEDQIWSDHPSFSIDIITDFQARYPDYEFLLVVGDDVVPDIPKWKEGEKLLETVAFLIIERNGIPKEGVRLPKKYVILPRVVSISSTRIRKLCEEQKSIVLFVPKSVEEYIRKRRLYRKRK